MPHAAPSATEEVPRDQIGPEGSPDSQELELRVEDEAVAAAGSYDFALTVDKSSALGDTLSS